MGRGTVCPNGLEKPAVGQATAPPPPLQQRLVRIANQAHLIYLGLLPSVATFVLLQTYGYRAPFLLFIGGVVLTAVYLAVTYSYTRLPTSVPASLWALLDGPLFALAAPRTTVGPLSFAVNGFLIDGIAFWCAIVVLAFVASEPLPWQRVASAGLGLLALAALASLAAPYVRQAIETSGWAMVWLPVGILESTALIYPLLRAGNLERADVDSAGVYIAVMIVLWVAAMSAGIALHTAP
jgi:hypothetical protein